MSRLLKIKLWKGPWVGGQKLLQYGERCRGPFGVFTCYQNCEIKKESLNEALSKKKHNFNLYFSIQEQKLTGSYFLGVQPGQMAMW